MATPVSTVRTKLIGTPTGNCHFHAPSCHPTDSTTDAMATMTTVRGNQPVMRSMLIARVLMISVCLR